MKWLKVFAVFVLLHTAGWVAAHVYQSNNPKTVLVVADTSFDMKPHFSAMESWITDFEQAGRYQEILIGTDKAMIGPLTDIQSRNTIFRAAFGKSSADSLQRYNSTAAREKIFFIRWQRDPRWLAARTV